MKHFSCAWKELASCSWTVTYNFSLHLSFHSNIAFFAGQMENYSFEIWKERPPQYTHYLQKAFIPLQWINACLLCHTCDSNSLTKSVF